MIQAIASFVDWKRALVMLPVLAAAAIGFFLLLRNEADSSTPRARLLDTVEVGDTSVGTRQGQTARDFTAFSPDGDVIQLSGLRGAPVIINFWASWCTSCLAELPDLRDLQEEIGPEELTVLAINIGEDSGRAKAFLKDLDVESLRAAMDPTLVVADAYGVRGMPQSIFVDADGIIRAVYVGQLTESALREYLTSASDRVDQSEAESGPLRIVTTVARDRVLEVDVLSDGRVEFRSKSLRCDDAYCAAPAVDALEAEGGVLRIERLLELDPGLVTVAFDPQVLTEAALTEVLASQLEMLNDPLYTRPLEIIHR